MNRNTQIDMVCPVNWLHPLNRGLLGWWRVVRGITSAAKGSVTDKLSNLAAPSSVRGVGTLSGTGPLVLGHENASLSEQSTFPRDFARQADGVVEFNGVNDFITVDHDTYFNPTEFTVAFWQRHLEAPAANHGLISKTNLGWTNGWGVVWYPDGTQLRFWAAGAYTAAPVLMTVPEPMEWNHYAMTWGWSPENGEDRLKVYLNGRLYENKDPGANVHTASVGDIDIGRIGGSLSYVSNCRMDDIRFWKRPLSEWEIAEVYRDSAQGCPRTLRRVPSLVVASPTTSVVPAAMNSYRQRRSMV